MQKRVITRFRPFVSPIKHSEVQGTNEESVAIVTNNVVFDDLCIFQVGIECIDLNESARQDGEHPGWVTFTKLMKCIFDIHIT